MNYEKITCPDINNGLGCRVTLWLTGCSNNCKGCQNAWLLNRTSGKKFDENAYQELTSKLKLDYIDGLTISGGDPLDLTDPEKLEDLYNLIVRLNEDGLLHPNSDAAMDSTSYLWIYTGHVIEDLAKNKTFVKICNYMAHNKLGLFIVDGKFDESQKDLSFPFRGSLNQRIFLLVNDKKSFLTDINLEKDISGLCNESEMFKNSTRLDFYMRNIKISPLS